MFVKYDYVFFVVLLDGLFVCDCCSLVIFEVKCFFLVKEENINLKVIYKCVDFLEEVDGSFRLRYIYKYFI